MAYLYMLCGTIYIQIIFLLSTANNELMVLKITENPKYLLSYLLGFFVSPLPYFIILTFYTHNLTDYLLVGFYVPLFNVIIRNMSVPKADLKI